MSSSATAERTTEAPHGRDEKGDPLAPYGYKTDGTPRMSNRGRKTTGSAGPAPKPRAAAGKTKAAEQKQALCALADMVITPGLALVTSPGAAKRIGEQRAMGVAGSLVILDGYVPSLADQAVAYAQQRPGFLAFLDGMDEKAPLIAVAVLVGQMGKAMISNILHPNPRLAEAAQLRVQMRAVQMADAIEAEARRLGITVPTDAPREHAEPMGAAA